VHATIVDGAGISRRSDIDRPQNGGWTRSR
jgi:hypothetical protein